MKSKDFLKEFGNNVENLGTSIDKIYNSNNNLVLFGTQDSDKTIIFKKLCGVSFEITIFI